MLANPLRRRPAARLLPLVLAGTLTAMALSATAVVATATPALAAATPTNPDLIASAQAIATGAPVTVAADTTESSTIVANPDGSFTLTSYAQPTQVNKGGTWVPVNATLAANADGTYSPTAAVSGLAISGGGTKPLAVFDDHAGHVLSVSMPMTLPQPQISGATALYPSVLPGVDLSVTAGTDGSLHEVLIVNNATAAANPALASLRLATSTTNLTLTSIGGGALTATDPSTGATVFTAPPPVMWDSGTSTSGAAKTAATKHTAGTLVGADDTTAALDAAGNAITSTTAGPGDTATVTAIPDTAGGGAVTLTPPTAALTGSGVSYPEYIDPSVSPVPKLNAYAYTQSYHKTTTAYKPTDNLRVGFDDWTSNCGSPCYQNGISRTFLNFTGLAAIDGKHVSTATLTMDQTGASCTGDTFEILAAITASNAGFSSSLDWTNQPDASTVNNYVEMSGADGDKTFNLVPDGPGGGLGIGPYMAAHNYTSVNLDIYAASEGNDCTWRHFALTPALSIVYHSNPNTPSTSYMVVKNGNASTTCSPTSPGTWVPKASNDQITLDSQISSPDASALLTSTMNLSSNAGSSYTPHAVNVTEGSANALVPAVTPLITLTSGASYQWYTVATDRDISPNPTSANSATCYFQYDGTSPTNPSISSIDLPVNGPGTLTGSPATGTINFTSTDVGSGIKQYNYVLNGTPGNTTGTSLSVLASALRWGTNTLTVQAQDNVGNLSAAQPYNFYVAQSSLGGYAAGTAGDISGDSTPDLVTVDAAGDIQLYPNPETTSVDPTGDLNSDPNQYGGRTLVPANVGPRWPVPDNASAADALVTHAGSYHGNNNDDLIMVQNGYLYVGIEPSSGGTGTWTFTDPIAKPACSTCTNYNGADWSSVQQIVAVATIAGQAPDLLTMEYTNGTASIWLYKPGTAQYTFDQPTLVSAWTSAWTWASFQIIGAGSLPGHNGISMWVRNPVDGNLYQFYDVASGISTPATTRTQVGSGYTATAYPLMTTVGNADAVGNLPIWATKADHNLYLIPTTTKSGVTTIGTEIDRDDSTHQGVWATHQIALGDSYPAYNNMGIATTAGGATSFDTTYNYSATALASMTFQNGATAGCTTGEVSTCPYNSGTGAYTGLAGGSTMSWTGHTGINYTWYLPDNWAQTSDNYAAAGQVLPAPIPNTGLDGNFNPQPAQTITFLGAGTTSDHVNGTTVSATVTYTDGHTQLINITFADWTVGTDTATGDTTLATAAYRTVSSTGATDNTPVYLFASGETTLQDGGAALPIGVQIASITLGTNAAVHIFSIAVGAPQ